MGGWVTSDRRTEKKMATGSGIMPTGRRNWVRGAKAEYDVAVGRISLCLKNLGLHSPVILFKSLFIRFHKEDEGGN